MENSVNASEKDGKMNKSHNSDQSVHSVHTSNELLNDYEKYQESTLDENAEAFTDVSSEHQKYFPSSEVNKYEEYSAEHYPETGSQESPEDHFYGEFDFHSKIQLDVEKSLTEIQKREEKKRSSALAVRLNMISKVKELFKERKRLKIKNGFLHKKCKDFLGKYKVTSYFEKSTGTPSIYSDERYEEILEEFKEIQMEVESKECFYKNELEDLEINYEDGSVIFDEIYHKFGARQIEVASDCLEEKYAARKVQYLQKRQEKRLAHLIEMRVKFLKMKVLLERINNERDASNNFGEGRTINHYTNLLATKNRLAERLDEREEDVVRVRRKIFAMAPILSHVKETSHGTNIDIGIYSSELNKIGELNNKTRSFMVEQGRRKDLIRKKFSKLYQTAFLLVNPKLLQVLMNSAVEVENLKDKIESIQLLLKNK